MSYTKEQVWNIYTTKNPHWKTANVTLTPNGLKKLVEESYNQGYKHGVNNTKRINENIPGNKDYDNLGIFNDLFKYGKGK